MNNLLSTHFKIGGRVARALQLGAPVVALESTVITHGLPAPQNLELALAMEEMVHPDAVPATIGLVGGRIKVGLDPDEMKILARSETSRKISARDLSLAVSNRWDGGTTVSATMFTAHRCGIRVFATGGIGGVHRGAVYDISSDLQMLARTPMVVVCSGAKIILDLPATRELLETFGVPVIGYQTVEFPAFFSSRSGLVVDHNAGDAGEIAAIAEAHWSIGLDSAVLVVNPPPPDYDIPRELLEDWVWQAVQDAEKRQVTGAGLTPYLLQALKVLSAGRTVETNLALLKNNARLAAQIATRMRPTRTQQAIA